MNLKHIAGASLIALSLALVGCKHNGMADKTDDATAMATTQSAKLGTFGIATENLDTSVQPGENFFKYVNGTWLKNTPIPSDRSNYSNFGILREQAEARVRTIIETAADKASPSADEKRIGDFYNAFMDTEQIEKLGLRPLRDGLNRIDLVSNRMDVADLMADTKLGLSAPAGPYIYIDAKKNDEYAVYLTQSGLGLPNRDYYFEEGEKSDDIRAGYVDYMTTMFSELGYQDSRTRAERVMAFETALAEGHWTRVKQRDRDLTYNKMSVTELATMAPGMPWRRVLDSLGLQSQTDVIVREKSAIVNAAKVFAETDVEVLKDYMRVNYIGDHAAYLPKRIDDARFAFFGQTLSGQEEQRPRWKRSVGAINGRLGEVVGKVYVSKYFPESSKAQMGELVENLRGAFKEGIDGLEWMGEETKAQAQYKLAKFNPKVGYPDRWETYEGLEVDRDDLIGTIQSARDWEWQDSLSQIGQPIDRDEWGMTPQTVNAYYNSILNEIVFPAAILDAPFFDPNADPAVNYGGIGAVIGHEMGHGFDDQGRKSDGDGVQRDWWTEQDAENYEARAGALADQYSEFEPLPGEFLDGRLGLGENIGDLTGVTMAYNAYKRSLGGKEAPVIDDLTGDQRFFMAWAQVWAIKWKEEALSRQIKNGPHSPGEYRANGIVRNFDPWYEAFDIGPDDPMYLPPEKRVKIW